jgi:hypothetical protein
LAALAGFTPHIAHQIDSLELVEDLIAGRYGVGLLPLGRPTGSGVKVVPLAGPEVILSAYAATRVGRSTWPPLRAVLDGLRPTPGALDVRVRPLAVGLCGTDQRIIEGAFPAAPGVVIGHEICGTVDAIGADVKNVHEGDLVTIETCGGGGYGAEAAE